MELFLVRHGQSEANARLTSEMDSRLTPVGIRQSQLTAIRLHEEGLTRIFVSPFRRTLETAQPICAAVGLSAEVSPWVCEYFSDHVVDGRDFRGLSPAEIIAEFPFAVIGTAFTCSEIWWPGEIEDIPKLVARADRVRAALISAFGETEERILIVSHAEPIGRFIESFLMTPPHPERPPWSVNCGITHLSVPKDPNVPAQLVYLNDARHLGDLVT